MSESSFGSACAGGFARMGGAHRRDEPGGLEEAPWHHFARVMEIGETVLAATFEELLPYLDERRLVLGAETRWLGHGLPEANCTVVRIGGYTRSLPLQRWRRQNRGERAGEGAWCRIG